MSRSSLFPYDRWRPRLPELAEQYGRNAPFPHIHLTGFLDDAVTFRLAREFPRPDEASWIEYRHYNEKKLGKSRRADFPPLIGRLVDDLNAPEFVAWLSELTGIRGLIADPDLDGGGLHQTERGGFLNIHADFTMHHHRPNWRRRCNLILFLNEGWDDTWRGALELWDPSMKARVVRIAPLFNHAIVFSTTEESYHGYPDPLTCPPGVTRKSIALYYYTVETTRASAPRSTNYRARPGDGAKAGLIWLDKQLLAVYSRAKSRLGLSDDWASKILGLRRRAGRRSPARADREAGASAP